MRPRQIQVQRGAIAQVGRDLPAIDLRHLTVRGDHRDDDRAVEVLMTTRAQDPDALELSAQHRTLHPRLLRQPVAQRAVSKADLEGLEGFRRADPTALQVGQTFRTLQQCLMVEVDDLHQQLRILLGRL